MVSVFGFIWSTVQGIFIPCNLQTKQSNAKTMLQAKLIIILYQGLNLRVCAKT